MIEPQNYTIPRYLKIAVHLAERISSGQIPEGSKLKGRSVLSTEYGVSSETVRRAMSLLSDKDVVAISNGRGNIVLSREKAAQFIECFKDDERIQNMRIQLSQAFEKRYRIEKEIAALTDQIIDLYKYQRSELIQPVEIQIPPHSHVIGNSIGDLEIWHNTGATVIGIVHGQDTIVSPGPYYVFSENDTVIIAGDKNVIQRFNAYIND